MAMKRVLPTLALIITSQTTALQVSPDSPCSSVCVDDFNQDISSPNNSNTFGSDIVCLDDDYSKTVAGEKYRSCVSCLQTSTAKSTEKGKEEDDQSWFLYNLRYSLSSCLYKFSDTSDEPDPSCSTEETCGPLQEALETGLLDPDNGDTYSYCSANDNSILGGYLSKCIGCLKDKRKQTYLANFLVALQAGCMQRSKGGMLIGLEGSVFSTESILIKYPGYSTSDSDKSTNSENLSRNTIIGIAIGVGAAVLIIMAILGFYLRKRILRHRMERLRSPLDPRFGAKNITSPNNGAYGNPYASPPINVKESFIGSAYTAKELTVLNPHPVYPSHHAETKPTKHEQLYIDTDSTASSPPYSGTMMPTHQAYHVDPYASISPTTSITTSRATSSTYYVSNSPPTSKKTSPRSVPPPIQIPARTQIPATSIPRTEIPNAEQESSRIYPPGPHSQLKHHNSTASRLQQAIELQQRQHSRQNSRSNSQTRQLVDSPPRSRSNSLAESWRRRTSGTGVGNSNASMERPLHISAPTGQHASRFDFELAERERFEKERGGQGTVLKNSKRNADVTPSSAESEEQWPGTY